MDSDLEEGEIIDDAEEARLSLEKGRGRREALPNLEPRKNGATDHGAHKKRRKDGRVLDDRSRRRKSPVNGRINARSKAPDRVVSNPVTQVRRLRMDSISKILSRRGKRRVESVRDSSSHSSKSIVITADFKRSTKDSETKENKISYGQVSNPINRAPRSINEKRGYLHLTEVERNEMICSLENLTRGRSSNSGKNGMSDISDTSDDDRSIVSLEPPAKPVPELIILDDSPDSEGEDVEALQLRKQIIQDLMSKYENTKAVDFQQSAPVNSGRNDDEEPYSPVDEDVSQKSPHIQTSDLISSWLEQAKNLNVEYPALSISAQNAHSNFPKPNNVVDNIQAQTLVQYPLVTTENVTTADNTYSTAITGHTVLYSNNLFLPQTHQLGCGDVDMRLLNFQTNATLSSTHVPLQYTPVMAPDVFKPAQVGPNLALNNFHPQTSNLPSIINDPFGRSFPISDFVAPALHHNRPFPYGEPFVEHTTFNHGNSTLQMKPSAHWNQFASNSLSNDNGVNMPGFHSVPPPLPDTAPPAPPPPPPLDTFPPPSSHVQNPSSSEILETRIPSPAAQIFFPANKPSTISTDQSYSVVSQEPQQISEVSLSESQDIDDRAAAYASTFEVLNLKNPTSTSDDETAVSNRKTSSKTVCTNSGKKHFKQSVSTRHRSSSSDPKESCRVSRKKHRSVDRSGSKSSHKRDSPDHYRRRSHSRSRRRESCKSSKTDTHYSERRKRRDSSPSPVRRSKISRTDSNTSSGRRHSSPEPFSPVSSSTNPLEKSTSAHSVQHEKEEPLPIIPEKSIDAVGSAIIVSVNNENAITSPLCEPTSTVTIIEPVAATSEPSSDLQAYSVDDEEILRAQLLLDMARKKNSSIPSPISVALKVSQSPVMHPTNSVLPTVSADQSKRAAVSKANVPVPSPPLFVKDSRPTILKSVSNPRSKNRQIVRVANVAPNSVPNFRLQKTITNNTKNPSGPNNLHRIQRTVINTNLLKKNVYNKNADPVMRYLQITVPNKIVTPLIIPAGRDDTSSEDEVQDKEVGKSSTRDKVEANTVPKIQSSNASKGLPADFEMSLNNLLRTSRQQTSTVSKTPAPSEAVKHLPPGKQQEYMRLKLQLEAYERKIQKKERAQQEHKKVATIPARQQKRPDLRSISKSILPISNVSLNVTSNADSRLANQVQNESLRPEQNDQGVSSLPVTEEHEVTSNSERMTDKNKEVFSVVIGEKSAISTISEAVTTTPVCFDDYVPLAPNTNTVKLVDIENESQNEENASSQNRSTTVHVDVQEGGVEEGHFDEQNLLEDDDDANGDHVVDFISAENEDKLLESDDEGIMIGAIAEALPINFVSTKSASNIENDIDASMESSIPENTSYNPESCLDLDDILNTESLEDTSMDAFEVGSPQAHVVDVVKQREELYLREKLLKAALLKKMEASNDRITLRKLEREVLSSRRYINRELTSLLSEMVKMSDLKVVLKSRQDKVISLREQLYAAEQHLNHTISQLQARETRRKSLTARVIDMRKGCVDLVKNCRVQGSKIDRNYKVPSGEHLEMKSKLVEVRNQNLVFQRENLKLKMSPRKKSFLEQQGLWKGYRKPVHMSATLAAASRVKKSFNACLKGKKRVGLSNSIYDPVKSKFKLPTTPQQLKSPVRRPNNYRHAKKIKSLASMGSPMLLTKHGKTAQDPWDSESVFLLPKVLFQDVLIQEETPPVKFKSIPIVPYCVYQSPLESIRKQKKHLRTRNNDSVLVVDNFFLFPVTAMPPLGLLKTSIHLSPCVTSSYEQCVTQVNVPSNTCIDLNEKLPIPSDDDDAS